MPYELEEDGFQIAPAVLSKAKVEETGFQASFTTARKLIVTDWMLRWF